MAHDQKKRRLTALISLWLAVGLWAGLPAVADPVKATAPAKPAVLSPDTFSYPMKMGYAAARQYPEAISSVFCYCGCDQQNKHTSLLDCYVTSHGAYCAICLEEAIEVKQLKDKGAALSAIQSQIDGHFAKLYPFRTPSNQLIKYRDSLKKMGIKVSVLPGNRTATSGRSKQPTDGCCAHNNGR